MIEDGSRCLAFEPDEGSLMELAVFETDRGEWQRFLDYVTDRYAVVYTKDGAASTLPRAERIFEAKGQCSVVMEVVLPGFTINSHFLRHDEIRLNALPEDIDTSEKSSAVFQFMLEVAELLSKEVFLTPEFAGATPTQLRSRAVCFADPETRAIRLRRSDSG